MASVSDPFLLAQPAIVSFSGGRTSAYMLWRVLRASGGSLPGDVVVVFCNTGKERPETLDFVERCSLEWGVQIRWLEYRHEPGRHYFAEVNYATASRNGEPFEMVIAARGFLPNPVMRFCTAELKIRTSNRFARQALGWGAYRNAIGLRADEPARVAKMRKKRNVTVERTLFEDVRRVERGAERPPGESPLCPLFDAGVAMVDVADFWKAQPFDLALPMDGDGKTKGGNCDLCFLKGARTLVDLIRERPGSASWWAEMETRVRHRDRPETARFRADRPPYAELAQIADGNIAAPGWLWADKGGLDCGAVIECNCTD